MTQARERSPGAHGVWRRLAWVVRGVVGLAVLALAVGLIAVAAAVRPEPERQDIVERAPLVRVTPVGEARVARVWTGYGTARAMNTAEVAAQVSDRVVERPDGIEDGARVSSGDLIVRLDPVDFQARLESAERLVEGTQAELDGLEIEAERLAEQVALLESELELELRDLRRYSEALERGAGTVSEAERRQRLAKQVERTLSALRERRELLPSRRAALEARLLQQEADVRLRREDLARTEIRSPIDGFLQSVSVEEGELVSVGQTVARVVDLSRVEAPLRLPISASGAIARGDTVTLEADGADSTRWTGEVDRIAPEADPSTRTVTVFAVVQQAPEEAVGAGRAVDASGRRLLLPGQFVMGEVSSESAEPRLIVPRRAVDGDRVLVAGSAPGVSASAAARATGRRVVVSHHIEGSFPLIDPAETQWAVLVSSDLSAGDRVIVTNLDQLGEGALVRVASEGGAPVRPVAGETEDAESSSPPGGASASGRGG